MPKKDYSDICLQGTHYFIKQNEEHAHMMYSRFFSACLAVIASCSVIQMVIIYAASLPLDDKVEIWGSWEGRLVWQSAVNKIFLCEMPHVLLWMSVWKKLTFIFHSWDGTPLAYQGKQLDLLPDKRKKLVKMLNRKSQFCISCLSVKCTSSVLFTCVSLADR